MNTTIKEFWNERYGKDEYVYGEEPNLFFAEQLDSIPSGKILLPCDGEGRNGVYAATKGWQVSAFDLSDEGRAKAMLLAGKKGVTIDYQIEDALRVSYPENSFDAIALIFAHFPPEVRIPFHKKVIGWLKPGGYLIMEVYNPKQLKNETGGPKDISMLYSEENAREDFGSLQTILLKSTQVVLNEGAFHNGLGDVTRFVGRKK
jgi:hypothetical protein